jgi:hypothetical protein
MANERWILYGHLNATLLGFTSIKDAYRRLYASDDTSATRIDGLKATAMGVFGIHSFASA